MGIKHAGRYLLLRVLQFLLLPLRHEVVQPAQLALGEDEVQQLPDEHQRQHLNGRENYSTSTDIVEFETLPNAQMRGDSRVDSYFEGWYHHGEDDSGPGGLDDPQQGETRELDDGEEVNLPQGHVAEVDEVRLVLGWHAEQLEAVKELQEKDRERTFPYLLLHRTIWKVVL